MNNHFNPRSTPTFSMMPIQLENGSWGVSVQISGLESEQQAQAAMQHMQDLFCSSEIELH